jgi:hypothetical protein
VLDVKTIDLTQYTPPTQVLNDGHYYWRVAGIDESGNLLTWSAPRAFTVNATGPLVAWASPDGTAISGPLRIAFNEAVRGVNSNTVKVVPDGYPTSAAVPGILKLGATSTQYTFRPFAPLATGGSYDIVVSKNLVDANGNHVVVFGGPLRVHRTATNHSPGWTYSQGWTRHRASGAFSGSYVSASAGRQASLVVSGSVAGLYACKGPGMGTLTVKVAGHTRTVSENQSFTSCGVLVWHQSIPSGEHRLTVTVASGHGDIDAVAVS